MPTPEYLANKTRIVNIVNKKWPRKCILPSETQRTVKCMNHATERKKNCTEENEKGFVFIESAKKKRQRKQENGFAGNVAMEIVVVRKFTTNVTIELKKE